MAGTWAPRPRPPALLAQRSRLLHRCTPQKSWIAFWRHSSLFTRRPQTPHVCETDPRLKHPKGDSHNQQHQTWKQRIKLGPARAWLLWRKEIKPTVIRPERTSLEHQQLKNPKIHVTLSYVALNTLLKMSRGYWWESATRTLPCPTEQSPIQHVLCGTASKAYHYFKKLKDWGSKSENQTQTLETASPETPVIRAVIHTRTHVPSECPRRDAPASAQIRHPTSLSQKKKIQDIVFQLKSHCKSFSKVPALILTL